MATVFIVADLDGNKLVQSRNTTRIWKKGDSLDSWKSFMGGLDPSFKAPSAEYSTYTILVRAFGSESGRSGPFPDIATQPNNEHVSIFLVLHAQYEFLAEVQDTLTDSRIREPAKPDLLGEVLGCQIEKKTISPYTIAGRVKLSFLCLDDPLDKPLGLARKNKGQGTYDTTFECPMFKSWARCICASNVLSVLLPSIPLAFNEYNTGMMTELMRFMAAVKKFFDGLRAVYETPLSHQVAANQIDFPYSHSYPVVIAASEDTSTLVDKAVGAFLDGERPSKALSTAGLRARLEGVDGVAA
ncbi:hypothetical protein DFH08DRAFT_797530 [Mycena albidolilacea]|uniref:Uncharacterized protein n=1 Tax=Mycena albidolilacea TaxID=1033008 RepID=A0AAD7F5F1_9AGAR|nr:hypothetical protein DFH08DRAFT_797530 [Mycena albidolilacea]